MPRAGSGAADATPRSEHVTASRSPKLALYAGLGSTALVAGLLAGRPALVALGAPLLLFTAAALLAPPLASATGSLHLETQRALEGDRIAIAAHVACAGAARLELAIPSPDRLELDDHPYAVGGREADVTIGLSCGRWGAHRIGPLVVRAFDALGVWSEEGPLGAGATVRIYPREETLRSLLAPSATQALTGSRRSAARADGIEYADVRQYAPGDPLRRVHWRASARSRHLYVTQRHPERNADVVLLVDGSADVRDAGGGTLDDAARAAMALARLHLAARDRVALVGTGGGVWWLTGGLGARQRHRIVEALLEGPSRGSIAWHGAATIDRRVLPTGALVLAITPLVARRMVDTLLDLLARGRDVAVVEIDPRRHLLPARDPAAALARRLWTLERRVEVEALRAAGARVATWGPGRTLEEAIDELVRWRRTPSAGHA